MSDTTAHSPAVLDDLKVDLADYDNGPGNPSSGDRSLRITADETGYVNLTVYDDGKAVDGATVRVEALRNALAYVEAHHA